MKEVKRETASKEECGQGEVVYRCFVVAFGWDEKRGYLES